MKVVLACFLLLVFVGIVFGSVLWRNAIIAAEAKLPELERAELALQRPTSEIVSSDGIVLARLQQKRREWVPLEKIPSSVINATIAAEDKRFWNHGGVDPVGIGRSLLVNVREGRLAQGFSTITMQIAKITFTKGERTLERKLQDVALATVIERRRTKEQILEIYLNQMFYGNGSYGVSAAAETYFGKELDELSLSEAALLARCVRRPSDQNPFANLAVSTENRNIVLKVMLDEKWITQDEYDKAISEKVKLAKRKYVGASQARKAPYFVDYVMDEVHRKLPEVNLWGGGYRLETSINWAMQQAAEREVESTVRSLAARRVKNGAFILIDRNGRIKALVGGSDYSRSQFNVMTQGRRQPGSAFKPFVYATALAGGYIGPREVISNERLSLPMGHGKTYSPRNSNGKYGGSVSLETALAYSINIPAVRTILKVGPRKVVEASHEVFGIKSELDPVASLALGSSSVSGLEMARAYSVFMRKGERVEPSALVRLIGPDGAVLYEGVPETRRVLDRRVAETMDSLLRGVVTRGTAKVVSSVKNARGKTGTTNSFADAWFVGYTDQLLGVGWLGNEAAVTGTRRVFGGEAVAPMWRDILTVAQEVVGEANTNPRSSVPRSVRDSDAPKPPAETPGDAADSPEPTADSPKTRKPDRRPKPTKDAAPAPPKPEPTAGEEIDPASMPDVRPPE